MTAARTHTGSCACGAVTYRLTGDPKRVGLCHCVTCRRHTGAPFGAFAIYRDDQVEVEGETGVFRSSDKGRRHFCAHCGSPIFGRAEGSDEVDIYAGTLDEPERFVPTYQLWTVRRLPWLVNLEHMSEYAHNREQAPR
jgi:hypothetical protein